MEKDKKKRGRRTRIRREKKNKMKIELKRISDRQESIEIGEHEPINIVNSIEIV